ncbi:PQQ-binding-like beta-propeller repeat protein [Streptomyces sp. NPDC051561]|uniref:serine/threonine-protein kinase n=1 Tax=Streptomyces sp. NPDC051561 TaxID=3365658 RepID=UPI0037BABC44
MTLSEGDPDSIGGHRVVGRLGTGGMGTVFLGRSPSGREVAVKLVHEQYASDPDFRARFRREVVAARRVSGAFTAPVVDADPEAVRPWMATQYVPGPTLAQRLRTHGPLSGSELRELALGLVEALRDIHRAGVVHRDLKPANVLIAPDGPRVIDFGISRASDHQTMTVTGHVMGTPPFMSPEQLVDPRTAGPPSDVFSLAALLVYAAVGRGPFDADSPYLAAYQVVHGPPDLTEVPAPLREIVERCLTKEPAQRPGMDALERDFRGMADGWAALPLPEAAPWASEPTAPTGVPSKTAGAEEVEGAQGPSLPSLGSSVTSHGAVAEVGARKGGRRRVLVAGAAALALGLGGVGLTQYVNDRDTATSSPREAKNSARRDTPAANRLPTGWRPWKAALPSDGTPYTPDQIRETGCLTAGSATYCGGIGTHLARLDQASGRTVWTAKARRLDPRSDSLNDSRPVAADDRTVFVAEDDGVGSGRYRLVALDAADGHRRWQQEVPYANRSSAAIVDRLVLLPGAAPGEVVARDSVTGAVRWRSAPPPGLLCDPFRMERNLYGDCRNQKAGAALRTTYVRYDRATGKQTRITGTYDRTHQLLGEFEGQLVFARWRQNDVADASLHDESRGDFDALVTVDPTGARSVLPAALPQLPAGAPWLSGRVVYFVHPGGVVSAHSAVNGEQLWRTDSEVPNLGRPATDASGRHLYVPALDGRVLAFDVRTGKEVWRSAALPGRAAPNSPPVMAVRAGAALVVTRPDATVFGVAPKVPGAMAE